MSQFLGLSRFTMCVTFRTEYVRSLPEMVPLAETVSFHNVPKKRRLFLKDLP